MEEDTNTISNRKYKEKKSLLAQFQAKLENLPEEVSTPSKQQLPMSPEVNNPKAEQNSRERESTKES